MWLAGALGVACGAGDYTLAVFGTLLLSPCLAQAEDTVPKVSPGMRHPPADRIAPRIRPLA